MTMRYMIKGGYWKNVEDEMLKAGVMKYGLNQWSRLASLLPRKTAKQCKARWYEWLDPSIKKTEWSREEEEKLLHLSKIFPSQWRTIAPLVGRTPHQCVSHYEKLLDLAQNRGDLENDPRKLRPGEIDPTPEVRPARADPIDMEDDDKEMVAEARVRIANVKGKKAKRKAREKVIDEARRLAQLQKFRELRNAGVDFVIERKERNKKKEFSYNDEIPMQRIPIEKFDTTNEKKIINTDQNISNINITQFEGIRRDEIERKKRQEDLIKINKLKKINLPQRLEILSKDPSYYIKKNDLILPPPQLNEKNLKKLNKLTKLKNNQNEEEEEQFSPTDFLLTDSKKLNNLDILPIRTPRPLNNILNSALEASYLKDPIGSGSTIYEKSVNDSISFISSQRGNITPNPYKKLLEELTKKSHLNSNSNSIKNYSNINNSDKISLNSVLKSNNYTEYLNYKNDVKNEFDYFYLNDLNSKKAQKIIKNKLTSIFSSLSVPVNDVEIDLEYLNELQENINLQIQESNFQDKKIMKTNFIRNIFIGDEIAFLKKNLNKEFIEDSKNIQQLTKIQKKGYFNILTKIGEIPEKENKLDLFYLEKSKQLINEEFNRSITNNPYLIIELQTHLTNEINEDNYIEHNKLLKGDINDINLNMKKYLTQLEQVDKKENIINNLLKEKNNLEYYYEYIKNLEKSENLYMEKEIAKEKSFLDKINKRIKLN